MGSYFSRIFNRSRATSHPDSIQRISLVSAMIENGYIELGWAARAQIQDSSERPPNGVFIIKCWNNIERQRRIMRLWDLYEDEEFKNSLEMERRWVKIFVVIILIFVVLYSISVFIF